MQLSDYVIIEMDLLVFEAPLRENCGDKFYYGWKLDAITVLPIPTQWDMRMSGICG